MIDGGPRTAYPRASDEVPLRHSGPGGSAGAVPAAGESATAQALIEEARQRKRRRRRRYLLVSALVLVAAVLGFAARGVSGRTTARTAGSASTGPPQHGGGMPARIVVWTSDFRVEVVSSRTGRVLRTLATGVAEIHGLPHLAVSPSGVVYFDAARGIRQWVMRVPLAGGRPAVVAEGCMPAISPDGRLLAFVTNCDDAAHAPEAIEVRNLATGRAGRWAFPSYDHAVSAIAWSPDNRSLSFTFVGSQLGETGTRVLDTRSAGTLLLASPMRLGPRVQWAGFLTRRVGLAVEPSPGHPGRAVLAEVAVSNGRILRQLTTLSPPELATANIYDGTENTIIADPASRAVLIAGVGRRGSGAIYRWAFGMAKPVMIISGSSRAAWAGR